MKLFLFLSPIAIWLYLVFSPPQFGTTPFEETTIIEAILDFGNCSLVPAEAQRRLKELSSVIVLHEDLYRFPAFRPPNNELQICGVTFYLGKPIIALNTNPLAFEACFWFGEQDYQRTIRHEMLHVAGLDHGKLFSRILRECE